MSEKNYREVVLTGGPCSGKTTAKSWIARYFSEQGIRVLQPEEIPTQVISSGLTDFASCGDAVFKEVEAAMLDIHIATQNSYQKIAAAFAPEPVLIIYDRAEGDLRSYTGDHLWDELAAERGLDKGYQVYRYDMVIHLVTAALGALEHYTTENNPARFESAEDAAIRDRSSLQCWLGHPNLKIIDNSTDFQGKMERLINQIKPLFSIAEPFGHRRVYLLDNEPDIKHDLPHPIVPIKITETMLGDSGAWATSWDCGGQVAHFLDRDKGGISTASMISASDYRALVDSNTERRPRIDRERWCFHHQGKLCRLDLIATFDEWLLSVDLESEDEVFTPPAGLTLKQFDDSHIYSRI